MIAQLVQRVIRGRARGPVDPHRICQYAATLSIATRRTRPSGGANSRPPISRAAARARASPRSTSARSAIAYASVRWRHGDQTRHRTTWRSGGPARSEREQQPRRADAGANHGPATRATAAPAAQPERAQPAQRDAAIPRGSADTRVVEPHVVSVRSRRRASRQRWRRSGPDRTRPPFASSAVSSSASHSRKICTRSVDRPAGRRAPRPRAWRRRRAAARHRRRLVDDLISPSVCRTPSTARDRRRRVSRGSTASQPRRVALADRSARSGLRSARLARRPIHWPPC